ncbi:MAG: hypothetical protein GX894_03160 [Clostridia bacterium]|nr:hypothetical protein [Clostridia bacterium]
MRGKRIAACSYITYLLPVLACPFLFTIALPAVPCGSTENPQVRAYSYLDQ